MDFLEKTESIFLSATNVVLIWSRSATYCMQKDYSTIRPYDKPHIEINCGTIDILWESSKLQEFNTSNIFYQHQKIKASAEKEHCIMLSGPKHEIMLGHLVPPWLRLTIQRHYFTSKKYKQVESETASFK